MSEEQKILFGVDNSQFARDAVAAAGNLLKDNENLRMTIFHGIAEPDLSYVSKAPLSPEAVEKYLQLWSAEEQKILRQASVAATETGFAADRVDIRYEEKCKDPAISMLYLAKEEGFSSIALARWGAKTLAKNIMGSVTYKLINMAADLPVWMIDPRISSHDVLVTIVGAEISRRVMEHTAQHFAHLTQSRFTLFHVIPTVAPELHTSSYWDYVRNLNGEERQKEMMHRMEGYLKKTEQIANEGKEKLVREGVPEANISVKFQNQKEGISRDILAELEKGRYGILVLGRKGSRDIETFGLGSKATKLIHTAHALMVCLVN